MAHLARIHGLPVYELYIILSIFVFYPRLNGVEFAGYQCISSIFQLNLFLKLGLVSLRNIFFFLTDLSSGR